MLLKRILSMGREQPNDVCSHVSDGKTNEPELEVPTAEPVAVELPAPEPAVSDPHAPVPAPCPLLSSPPPRPYRYLGGDRALIELHEGTPFIVDTKSCDISVPLILHGAWEPWIEPHVLSRLTPGAVFVDAGANMGYYSILCARAVGGEGRVFSFEPNPRLHRILRENMQINGLSQATAYNCALAARGGRKTLWVQPGEAGGGFLTNDPNADNTGTGHQPVEVEVRRLDDVLPAEIAVDVLKVDVEGFEPEVVAGALAVIRRSPRLSLVIEVSPSGWRGQGTDPAAFLDSLAAMGFGFQLMLPDGLVRLDGPSLLEQAERLPFVTCCLAERTP